jgi:hypothetical protein
MKTKITETGDEEMRDMKMVEKDLSSEAWGEYDFGGRVYRITDPVKLFLRPGASTHRVVDSKGITHCMPAPGTGDCVLRWESREGQPKVSF